MDESDSDRVVFLKYFIAAIKTLFPEGCSTTHNLLTTTQPPPLDYLITTLINEITDLPEEFLLDLDDCHLIKGQDIHKYISTLVQHPPLPLRLVIAIRKDPSFAISRLLATQTMTEIRMGDLRFTPEEAQDYLKLCQEIDIPREIVTMLVERTEGWAVGLRLACLSMRDQGDYVDFLETFSGTNQFIVEYLVDEVLSRQPQPAYAFLLLTSILDRFYASLDFQ